MFLTWVSKLFSLTIKLFWEIKLLKNLIIRIIPEVNNK
jgi:hypothetical protein